MAHAVSVAASVDAKGPRHGMLLLLDEIKDCQMAVCGVVTIPAKGGSIVQLEDRNRWIVNSLNFRGKSQKDCHVL